MKIFALAWTVVVAFFSEIKAMFPDSARNERPFVIAQIQTKPPISVIQFPTINQIVFDANWKSKKVVLKKGDIYKNIKLKSTLRVTGDMDSKRFFRAVRKAFEEPCKCITGYCRFGVVLPSQLFFPQNNEMEIRPSVYEIPFLLVGVKNFHILKFPSAEEIIFDRVRRGKILSIRRGDEYKDVVLQKDLYLKCDMSNAMFLETICNAFGKPCTFIEGFYRVL